MSDTDAAPRFLDFLLAPSRINVAIRRFQYLSIMMGFPQLATGISSSIRNVEQVRRRCGPMAAGPSLEG